jgi:hypothetical protein
MLQGISRPSDLGNDWTTLTVIYVAPTFRHTHFDGKQVVVHNCRPDLHELFSYSLCPGPSAKRGIYGVLMNIDEQEGWVAAHCSTVQVVTPYDNVVTMMHEGASGSGKSEMLEYPHRHTDGTLVLGSKVLRNDVRTFVLPTRTCELRPGTDGMALCHPSLQTGDGKLHLRDAEDAWFVRVNHITHYGADPHLERLTAQPPKPLLFLNIDAVPGSRALIWEHTQDAPDVPPPNPRAVIPRDVFPGVVDEPGVVDGPVAVDIHSFGIRAPPCSSDRPTYGIVGLFHVLPPALGWRWRLLAPRGHANPSIVETEGVSSVGLGSSWPFANGRRVDPANLLLVRQFQQTTAVDFVLFPNQYIGRWHVGFMPQWIGREYFARRGSARFEAGKLVPARSTRCSAVRPWASRWKASRSRAGCSTSTCSARSRPRRTTAAQRSFRPLPSTSSSSIWSTTSIRSDAGSSTARSAAAPSRTSTYWRRAPDTSRPGNRCLLSCRTASSHFTRGRAVAKPLTDRDYLAGQAGRTVAERPCRCAETADTSDHALLAQVGDRGRVEAEQFAQHLGGMLAELRPQPPDPPRRLGQPRHDVGHDHRLADARLVDRDQVAARVELPVAEDVGDVVDRAHRRVRFVAALE